MRTLRMIIDWYQSYFGSGAIGVLFVIGLVMLRQRRREDPKAKALFGCALLLCFIICFPPTAWVMAKTIGESVYWRVFWLLPVLPVLCWAGTRWVSTQKRRGMRALRIALCILLVACNARLAFSDAFFSRRENNFKLPTPVIRVADAVNAHAKTYGIRKKRTLSPISVAEYLRLYDASILQNYGRSAEWNPALQSVLFQEINAPSPDMKVLVKQARKKKIRYLILHKEQEDESALTAGKFTRIFDDNGYVVYANNRYMKQEASS